MPVPSSGSLGLYSDIGVELGVTQSNVSLGAMSDSAGFSAPDAMSDFYGYVDALAPTAVTNNATSVGTNSFTANGNITSDGGATITERGFYVGTNSASPTNNTKYTVGGTTGGMSRSITGLSDNVTYYIWAFATNSAGTSYGSRVSQTTVQAYTPTLVSSQDNGSYVYPAFIKNSGIEQPTVFSNYVAYQNPVTGGFVTIDSYYLSINTGYYIQAQYFPNQVYAKGTVNRTYGSMSTSPRETYDYFENTIYGKVYSPVATFSNYSLNYSGGTLGSNNIGDTYFYTTINWPTVPTGNPIIYRTYNVN